MKLFFLPMCVHWSLSLAHHRNSIHFESDGVWGGPLFAPPSSSACVQNRVEFVELGRGMCSNYHRRHYDYRLAPHTVYLVCTSIYGMYRYQRLTCRIRMDTIYGMYRDQTFTCWIRMTIWMRTSPLWRTYGVPAISIWTSFVSSCPCGYYAVSSVSVTDSLSI